MKDSKRCTDYDCYISKMRQTTKPDKTLGMSQEPIKPRSNHTPETRKTTNSHKEKKEWFTLENDQWVLAFSFGWETAAVARIDVPLGLSTDSWSLMRRVKWINLAVLNKYSAYTL